MSIRLSAMFLGMTFVSVLMSATVTPAQAQFSIRAASATPVEGWQKIQVEHSDRFVWISPDTDIVASDIEKAQPEVRKDGSTVIAVVFTDIGISKFHALTAAQFKKLIAMVVDGKVIWAPVVQYIADLPAKNNVLTGNLPTGLTKEEVARIMAALR